ncbi:MAG: hypothetical protein ACLGIV_08005 [Actinomycetes bacterium]
MERAGYHALTAELVRWARTRDDVIGVVGVGSTAGTAREPDEWSDHDVFVVTVDGAAEALRADLSWLPYPERHAVRYAETQHGRGVLYDDGHLVKHLVVGPARVARGEVLSGSEHVRGYAVKRLTSLVAGFVPPEQPGDLDNLDPLRRFEQAYPVTGARIAGALERPVVEAAGELLSVAEELLTGRVPAATAEAFAAVRRVLSRVRAAAAESR